MKKADSLKGMFRRDPMLRFRVDPELETVLHLRGNLAQVRGKEPGATTAALRGLIRRHADLFGPVSRGKLTVLEHTPDREGGMSLTLQQHHGPHVVQNGSVRAHVTSKGVMDTVRNRLFPDLAKVPRKSRISAEAAVKAAQRATKCKSPPSAKPVLLVVRLDGKPYLVWVVRLDDTRQGERGVPAQWVVYVNSTNGKVLLVYDNVQTAGPIVANGTGYYSGAGPVNAWFNDVTNQLRDTTRTAAGGPEIIVNDEDGASPSEDADADWNANTTPPRHDHQGPEVDSQRYAGAVVDYFRTVHGRNSFDGAAGNVVVLSHFGNNTNNGFWDGTRIKLGDGTGVAPGDDYECSDDWLAHELTHAYTQYTCGLVYLNESGALNESFSDIFAAFITGDWLVFEDTWLKASAPAWRNMIEPTNGGLWNPADAITSVLAGHQPSHYSVRYTGISDNGGVHINSGIINHLVYLLTVGGTHLVSGITVTGIGQSAAEQLVWRCMSVNLVGQPNATFLDFREAMLDACLDLFPTDLNMLTQVKNAFNAVGIGPDLYVRDNLADTGLEPYPGSYLWASPDIINRTAASADPDADFADLTLDSLWENVEFGQNNHVYVRVQNRGSESGDASINVYFSAASTFATPAAWIHIGTLAETGIAAGTMRVAGPLLFPSAQIPAEGHYCMIAVISDTLDPAPDHTLIASVTDYLHYVRNTNNIAYRNMDVVDAMPGTPGTFQVQAGAMARHREFYELRLDIARFVPGARVRVRFPRGVMDGAIAHGLALVARNKREDVFEIAMGRVADAQARFLNLKAGAGIGFDRVLLEKPVRFEVEWLVPEEAWAVAQKGRPRNARYELVVRQLWAGQAVGAVGVRVAPGADRPGRKPAKKKRRVR